MATYNFLPIAGAVIALYIASWLLARQGKYLSVPTHRRIWNGVLLISFIGTLVFSIANVALFDTGIKLLPFMDVAFWHVEFGIVCMIIALFHALWHIPYFKQYLPLEKPKPMAPVSQPAAYAPVSLPPARIPSPPLPLPCGHMALPPSPPAEYARIPSPPLPMPTQPASSTAHAIPIASSNMSAVSIHPETLPQNRDSPPSGFPIKSHRRIKHEKKKERGALRPFPTVGFYCCCVWLVSWPAFLPIP